MAQHDDLDGLGAPRPEPQRHQLERAPGQDVQQRQQHAGKPAEVGLLRFGWLRASGPAGSAGWRRGYAILFAIPALGYRFRIWHEIAAFWTAYVITRPLGASVADWLGKPFLGGLGLGDARVAVVLTGLIVLLVGYLAISRIDVRAEGRRDALGIVRIR